MVHDAVRPCVRHADLDNLIAASAESPDGVLLAAPVADTVKRADDMGRVVETVQRIGLWRALTPQMFAIKKLRQALAATNAAGVDITDESAAIERVGGRPRVIEGAADNIKITRPADLALAALFLKQQAVERS
jgi:2-C-methyl-D-erythritol 4-phosphate cytidylyltransferase